MANLINSDKARAIVKRHYGKSRNFMADRVIGYTMTHYGSNRAVEISVCTFLNHRFYGISIVDVNPNTEGTMARHDIVSAHGTFESFSDVKAFIFGKLADME